MVDSNASKEDAEQIEQDQDGDEDSGDDVQDNQDQQKGHGDGSGSDSDSENGEDGADKGPEEVEADELEALRKEAQEAGETLENHSEDGVVRKRKRRGEQDESENKRPPPATTSNLSAESSSIWESFKADAGKSASTSQPSTSTAFSQDIPTNGQANGNSQNGTEPKDQEQAYVKVIQTYRFAGDDVTTEKILPVSHPDAEAFIKKQKKLGLNVKLLSSPEESTSSTSIAPDLTSSTSTSNPNPTSIATSSSFTSTSNSPSGSTSTLPLPKPGPRRKKGSSLAALNAAVNAGKAPKMNTLEKSKLDWEGWKAGSSDVEGAGLTQQEREEMEAQTKGGGKGLGDVKGYMERRNFLERVGGRLEDKVEESKGRKR